MFSCEIYEFFKNAFFKRTTPVNVYETTKNLNFLVFSVWIKKIFDWNCLNTVQCACSCYPYDLILNFWRFAKSANLPANIPGNIYLFKVNKKKTLEKEVKYLKVNNKDTRKMSMTLTYLTPFSSVWLWTCICLME